MYDLEKALAISRSHIQKREHDKAPPPLHGFDNLASVMRTIKCTRAAEMQAV